jgi:hypothetical protein
MSKELDANSPLWPGIKFLLTKSLTIAERFVRAKEDDARRAMLDSLMTAINSHHATDAAIKKLEEEAEMLRAGRGATGIDFTARIRRVYDVEIPELMNHRQILFDLIQDLTPSRRAEPV